MRDRVIGLETEFGFSVVGRGPHDQVLDASSLVSSYPKPGFVGWDYRQESPRSDLRGFRLDALAVDPTDAQFDTRQISTPDTRADRQLPNGARFYNDHGHPEYSTPECADLDELVRQDLAGHVAVRIAAKHFQIRSGFESKLYKNNTDFHGASYGTHENYLCSRDVSIDTLFRALVPVLVARPIICGAGKVGSEQGAWCDFQLSQRADFFVEQMSADTLYRRPIFNTRDEPHGDPERWIRCHVIAGDANMLPTSTRLKVGFASLAVRLAEIGEAPCIQLHDPVAAAQHVSRDASHEFRLQLSNGETCTAIQILSSYLDAAETSISEPAITSFCSLAREALARLRSGWREVRHIVDWAAKRALIEDLGLVDGATWRDPVAQSLDLAYSDLDLEAGLCYGLREMGLVEEFVEDASALDAPKPDTRAFARHIAMQQLGDQIQTMSWSCIAFKTGEEIYLAPQPRAWATPPSNISVESFVNWCKVNQE